MKQSLIAVLWTLLLFIALVGWGGLVSFGSRLRKSLGVGFLAALGFALTPIIGGVISLLGWAGPIFSIAYALSGLVLFVLFFRRVDFHSSGVDGSVVCSRWIVILVMGLVVVLLFLRVFASFFVGLNEHDDFQAYLVHVVQLLDTGSLGIDPFNERRMLALGGQSFLQSVFLAGLPIGFIGGLDNGLAWLIFSAIVFGHARRRSIPIVISLLVLMVVQFMITRGVNVSSHIGGMVLIYALMQLLVERDEYPPVARMLFWSLLTAGLCSLKSTFLVPAILLPLSVAILRGRRHWRERAYEMLLMGVLVGALLSPWMYQLYMSSGTLLYPILGEGFHGGHYNHLSSMSAYDVQFAASIVFGYGMFLFLPLALVALLAIDKGGINGFDYAGIVIGAWGSIFVIIVISGVPRYSFPILLACAAFLVVGLMAGLLRNRIGLGSGYANVGISIVLVIFFVVFNGGHQYVTAGVYNIISLVGHEGVKPWSDEERRWYQDAQHSVPSGERILARASRPFLLDFTRNTVFVSDWPGGSSLPPGLPLGKDIQEIRSYFLANDIAYLLYSYADEAGHSYKAYSERLSWSWKNGVASLVQRFAEDTFMFQDALVDMGQQCTKTFDNGRIFVLDLRRPCAGELNGPG